MPNIESMKSPGHKNPFASKGAGGGGTKNAPPGRTFAALSRSRKPSSKSPGGARRPAPAGYAPGAYGGVV